MNRWRAASLNSLWTITGALIGGSLALGFLSQPAGPNWDRWLGITVIQGGMGAAGASFAGCPRDALRRLALKTALWPAIAAGLAGAARLVGIDLYSHLHAVALIALAGSHMLGERLSRGTETTRLGSWLLDLQWVLAIAGVPWSWNLASNLRLAEFLAGSALFLFLATPRRSVRSCGPERSRKHGERTSRVRIRTQTSGLSEIGHLVMIARSASARYGTVATRPNEPRRAADWIRK